MQGGNLQLKILTVNALEIEARMLSPLNFFGGTNVVRPGPKRIKDKASKISWHAAAADTAHPVPQGIFSEQSQGQAVFNSIHPPRPDQYEEFHAKAVDRTMKSNEREVGHHFKSAIDSRFVRLKILTVFDYPGIHIFGIDPDRKMERYAQATADVSGLPPLNLRFILYPFDTSGLVLRAKLQNNYLNTALLSVKLGFLDSTLTQAGIFPSLFSSFHSPIVSGVWLLSI
ncbi:hypothetical protein Pfo_009519 [Paulownia fortunei]|nr:hypothetical protein Pfo_009519 [Paulownia fortunei]